MDIKLKEKVLELLSYVKKLANIVIIDKLE